MAKYRKKPVVVEAFQWGTRDQTKQPDELDEFPWFDAAIEMGLAWMEHNLNLLKIRTLEGVMTASPGDYIIQGVKGEIYPCKPDIFEATYEEVTE